MKQKKTITSSTPVPTDWLDKLAESPVFSEACQNSFKIMAIVTELASKAGHTNMDALYEKSPDLIARYCDTALTALRGLQKLEEREKYLKPTEH